MSNLRICFVCQSLAGLGGLQRAVALLANELVSRGVDVSVLMDTPELGENPYGLISDVSILPVGIKGASKPLGKLVSKVRRHSGLLKPICHEHSLGGSVIDKKSLAAVHEALKEGRFDVVVGCDPLHTIVAVYACDGLSIDVCGWQHSTYDGYFNQSGRGFYGQDCLYAFALRRCKVNFVLTEQSKEVYELHTGHSAIVLPNSIVNMGTRGYAENCVLYCGRLDPGSKGADYIPRIAEALAVRGFAGEFLVVGDGPYLPSLEEWLEDARLPFKMELKGFVTDAERYYEQATVLISPSRWEGFGLSILEAMSHGVPCVAFENDGPCSLIDDPVDGLIVPNGDVESLAERTMEILGDERLRRSMGDAAVEAARGYLVGAQADRFLESLKG